MRKLVAAVVFSLPLVSLCGCAVSSNSSAVGSGGGSTGLSGRSLSGTVHGGQNPVNGSTIQLWTVGTTGYGSAATPMLSSPVATDANGNFSITGLWNCTGATYIYITATGGNSGAGTNSQLSMMAPIGPCSSLNSSSFLMINEVTTVAAAYALQGFINTATDSVGSYSYNNQGLVNAFNLATSLVNVPTGTAVSTLPSGNGIVPRSEINTLANILAACINSVSSAASPSSNCSTLLNAAKPANGAAPANTLEAIVDIARNPAQNVSTLYGLVSSQAPFQPQLTAQPNDWTVAVSYATGGTAPRALTLDALGNVWIANYGATGASSSSVSMMTPLGVTATNSPFNGTLQTTSSTGTASLGSAHPEAVASPIYGAYSIGADSSNRVWVLNHDNSTLTELTASLSGGKYTINTSVNSVAGSEIVSPYALALDGAANVWLTNPGSNTVGEWGANGAQISPGAGYTGGGLSTPKSIAIDPLNHVWVVNTGSPSLSEFDALGNPISATGAFTGAGLSSPGAVAVDGNNNIWITDTAIGRLSVFSGVGNNYTTSAGFTGGGLTNSTGIAVDGANGVWVADASGNRLSEFLSNGTPATPATGLQGGSLSAPDALAIDAGGDIWVLNGAPATVNGSVITLTEFVGAAAPSIMPLQAAAGTSQIGTRPGTPVPISILSQALPVYQIGSSYAAKVYATGGNSGTYTWSLVSGALPGGFTLAPATGLISGNSGTYGTSTFTLQACDTVNPTNCSQNTFSVSSSAANPTPDTSLSGTYILRYSGFRNTGGTPTPGAVYGTDLTASLNFDGKGNIIAGEIDMLSPSSASNTTLTGISGTYSLGADNRGIVILNTGSSSIEFAIAVDNFSNNLASTIHLIEYDDTQAGTGSGSGAIGSGIAKLQTPSAISNATLNQTFVYGLAGETPCTNYNSTNPSCPQTVTPFGPLSVAGRIVGNASNSIVSGRQSGAAYGISYDSPVTGVYTSPDSYGRGTLTLSYTGSNVPSPPTHFVYYIVNAGEMYLQSADGHLNTSMLAGDALVQTGIFNTSTFSGNYVAWENSGRGGDGLSVYPTSTNASIYYLQPNGAGSMAITSDQNKQGVVTLNAPQSPATYTVDSTGRIALGSGQPVLYLQSAQGAAFGTEQPASGGNNPGLLTAQYQTGAPFNTSTLGGTYAFADTQIPVPSTVVSGILGCGGTGTCNVAQSINTASGALSNSSPAITYTINGTTGRVTVSSSDGSTAVMYMLSNASFVWLPTSGTSTPFIVEGDR